MTCRFIVLAAAIAMFATSAAAGPSVLGVELGAPIVSCPASGTQACFTNLGESYQLISSTLPGYVAAVVPGVKQGIIVSLNIMTRGAEVQQQAYASLVQKFGKPSHETNDPVQNGYGATFKNVRAQWVKNGYVVTFSGIVGDPDSGMIRVMTSAEAKEESQSQDAPL